MDRYQKVEKPKPVLARNENEIRITAQGLVRNYVSYATSLLQENRGKEIVLKAMGQAINKTVAIAEIIKRRLPRLHQDTAISSVSITDVWEPIEEGLLPVEMTRHVSAISITLSTKELSQNSPGYQAPAFVEQTKPQNDYQHQQPRQAHAPNNAANEDSYGRGRGRGRGRGWGSSRGGYRNYQDNVQSRGGYGNYQDNIQSRGGYGNYQGTSYDVRNSGGYGNYHENARSMGGYGSYQENGPYSNWGRGGTRGRGWGYRGARYERGRGGEARDYGGEPGARYERGRGGEARDYGREPGARYERGRGGEARDYGREPGGGYERGRGGEPRDYGREFGARYERGRGGEARDYGRERGRGRGRGRMGNQPRGGGDQA
ncbi:protein argonaute 18-like isoform X3 [Cornus florida]|uniref:protein argonaute 18-like isoform X3 n=1 Tax=Cornus florida TaxID=4283 RepID=UPI00289C6FBE|nr:protein argonaute 18-like isoform X3 [Cornus florida]